MSLVYPRSSFTLDASSPIPEDAPPSVALNEAEAAEVYEKAEAFDEVVAGPVQLQTEGEDPNLTARVSVEGSDQNDPKNTRVVLEWGDGVVSDLTHEDPYQVTRFLDYGWTGTLVAHVEREGQRYTIAKPRTSDEPDPLPEV